MKIEFHPLTVDRWADLETLFGARGACGGCWCMWWRLKRSEFERRKGAANKRALRALVAQGPPPGILAYRDGRPAGWCAVGPRAEYPVLERSRVLKRVDDAPVWSVTCLFVAKEAREQGLSVELLRAAAAFAKKHGAKLVEGYPVDPRDGKKQPAAFVWTGLAPAFSKAGFIEIARRSPTRPIMRRKV
jgi:GNAT superfamily N-acetyltransferase